MFIDDGWAKHGTYCIIRRIQIHIETWDRTALEEQEATFGRKRHSGAPLTGGKEFDEIDLKAKDSHGEYIIDKDAHTRLAKKPIRQFYVEHLIMLMVPMNVLVILRQAYFSLLFKSDKTIY